ncbi:tRNA (adenosine(37)-N6)-threonylcarbamoyltransferase complex dimerization subunit type 1 TsaB [Kingella kingae]|uniref:tRNA (adenosine(37)-N6)-threonylcarbamoyltransferase complex dimerization subunit type 1 TsaB n=2 Tax=Kingella kingae TaxID=504 RepID=UPI0004153DC7|nr:tRNA (adenosine(37)-N6)-threonylcarbamoyltransferase complex dimerization subunit type 1 TsaB [Kingella kingae]MDK4538773.1 tRNA (adenosine(37)-N6)-threonylcarbamoyltransferase complex dimerization subunit type 1 TsaB [Kingella kingae]MDK4545947.1 tRNA (adenosine(37)-N6)-threonylcarbamoyltransferase complex dimerization subunit type 1 TsaB [Kingella kingae]MDK4621748.1 tRNA (adenosine(37)-N6)-threonylcarbamoyltransferase complex dimerization subunit type 1 TsaB [Kingella kingae]
MQPDFTRPILAIDTSTTFLSLALHKSSLHFSFHEEVGNKQSAQILPRIAELFAQADCTAADLGAIVYAKGAGAFTGLRIGVGVAQGLATPFGTPMIGVPCLDAVAYQIPNHECVLAATDARMGEVFYAWFDTKNHRRLSDYSVSKANEIALPENQITENAKGVGNAFAFALSEMPVASGSLNMPTAADYLALAQSGRYAACAPEFAELLYVRDKIALTAAEQAARKVQAA